MAVFPGPHSRDMPTFPIGPTPDFGLAAFVLKTDISITSTLVQACNWKGTQVDGYAFRMETMLCDFDKSYGEKTFRMGYSYETTLSLSVKSLGKRSVNPMIRLDPDNTSPQIFYLLVDPLVYEE